MTLSTDTRVSAGFGGRTFSADGRTISVEPKEIHKEDGRTNITLGFPFATLEDYVEPDSIATELAEYLSCPKRAAAPELYEALSEWLEAVGPEAVFRARRKATAALTKARAAS
jgi:hypothetical protein